MLTLSSDILKIDIEFAEFASLESLSKAYPREKGMSYPIGQILVELHLFQRNGMTSGQFLDWYVSHLHLSFPPTLSQNSNHSTKTSLTQHPLYRWEALEDRGLRATWTEPNLLAVTLNLEDKEPRLAEYSLINTKDMRSVLFESLFMGH
jgi:hypothetical protein